MRVWKRVFSFVSLVVVVVLVEVGGNGECFIADVDTFCLTCREGMFCCVCLGIGVVYKV